MFKQTVSALLYRMAQFLENQDEVNNIHHTSDLDNGEWHIFSCWVKYANNKWETDDPQSGLLPAEDLSEMRTSEDD